MKKLILTTILFAAGLCADEQQDREAEQKRLDQQRIEDKIWRQKLEDERIERQRVDDERYRRKRDDEEWERRRQNLM